ncbi:MAG: uncharacterized protein JWP33_578 [Blastococcus sp.]|nr:uncharacterized protein [Blastococcus sp.]
MAGRFSTVDDYVDSLPEHVRPVIAGIRRCIRDAVPGIGETISYSMPTFVLDGRPLVHVAAWKKHIGLYPLPPMDDDLAREVAPYRGAKDAMHLPYDRPIPYALVERVVAVLLERRAELSPRGRDRPAGR